MSSRYIWAVWSVAVVCVAVFVSITAHNKWSREPLRFGAHEQALRVLITSGTFADSNQPAVSPGYAVALAAIARLDSTFAATITTERLDKSDASSLLLIQITLATMSVLLVPWIAFRLSGSHGVAALTLICAVIGNKTGEMAGLSVDAYVWRASLTIAIFALACEAAIRNSIILVLLTGVLTGIYCLFSPFGYWLLPVLFILLVMACAERGGGIRAGFLGGVAVGTGSLAVLATALWQLDIALPAPGQFQELSILFSQRAAIQTANFKEWLAASLTAIPLIGSPMEVLFSDETLSKLTHRLPNSFTRIGSEQIFPSAQSFGASHAERFVGLARSYALEQPGAYALATIPVALKGIWGQADIIGILGLISVTRAWRYMHVDHSRQLVALVFVPAAWLFLGTTLFTTNETPFLLLPFCLAIGYVFARL